MNVKSFDFVSDSGGKIPSSFKSGGPNEGWIPTPSPNFSSKSATADIFESNESKSDLFENPETDLFSAESTLTTGLGYNALAGIALGSLNSGVGNALIAEKESEAIHGQGPLKSSYVAIPTAEHTASNEQTAVSIASGAMAVGGLFGPEGLAAGTAVGLGIDALAASGAFDASASTMMSTTGEPS
jgi:hypothetical protein